MLKKLTYVILGLLLSSALSPHLRAQQSGEVPAAPIPPAIASAKTAFISNCGQQGTFQFVHNAWYSGGPNRPYDQFYAAMKRWGRFELVAAPTAADIVLAIDFDIRRIEVSQFKLVIVDPKTNIPLWTLTQNVELAGRPKNREKNYNLAMDALVNDLKTVVSPLPGPSQK